MPPTRFRDQLARAHPRHAPIVAAGSDAAEMVRRAEWALGKAVKAGQERGEVRTRADNERPDAPSVGKKHVNDYMKPGREHDDISTMASVEADDFEAALTEARGNGR